MINSVDIKNKYGNASAVQLRAIKHGEGPLLILAGPGSGKTFTLVGRMRFLIEEKKINPSRIMMLTFSKKAAGEMRGRFEKLNVLGGEKAVFGTFHAIYFGILRTAYGYNAGQVVTEEEKYKIIKTIIDKYDMNLQGSESELEEIVSEISYFKEELPFKFFKKRGSKLVSKKNFDRIYSDYEKILGEIHKIDFEDMMQMTLRLLRERKDIRNALKNRYEYILIDEFQDINRMQYETIKLLTDRNSNITAVGDDDQAIYGFRGSNPKFMKKFEEEFKNTTLVELGTNYRSTEKIVSATKELISHNRHRYRKNLAAFQEGGEEIEIKEFEDIREEYSEISKRIINLMSEEKDDIAVLFRTNIQRENVLKIFEEYKIDKEKIQLRTFHDSKGLEFDYVFIIDANEKITPYKKAVKPHEIEEERRMFYVAATRARKKLSVFYCRKRYSRYCKVSRFVKELKK